jgi:cyclic beta-1,2-glucan synthetase
LENFQSIDETIINLQQTLNPKLGSRLPLEDDEANELRIINVLNNFVQKRRLFSSRTLITYLNEYQKTHHLTLAELWFVAPALQALAIIELESILRPIFSKQGTKLNGEVEAKIKYLILTLIHSTKVNWKKLVEGTSYVEHILRSDPAGIYPLMDFKTRDTYRHAVENLAQRSRANEFIVADLILKMAKDKRTVNRHVGYYLVGSEKHRLEDSIGYHQHLLEKFQSVVRKTQGKNVA